MVAGSIRSLAAAMIGGEGGGMDGGQVANGVLHRRIIEQLRSG